MPAAPAQQAPAQPAVKPVSVRELREHSADFAGAQISWQQTQNLKAAALNNQ